MKKLIATALVALVATNTAFANPTETRVAKKAIISIPENATPTLYECDGKDIAHEKVKNIRYNADGTTTIEYEHKRKKPNRVVTCQKMVKAYG